MVSRHRFKKSYIYIYKYLAINTKKKEAVNKSIQLEKRRTTATHTQTNSMMMI